MAKQWFMNSSAGVGRNAAYRPTGEIIRSKEDIQEVFRKRGMEWVKG